MGEILGNSLGNLFEFIPGETGEEQFNVLALGDNIRIERIISKGHSSPASGWYDQEENEWVVVLKGEANIAFETGDEVHLTAGCHITIPAHTRHKVTWTTPDTETIWLAVHYK
jgi:cupin 2 domain-containing protein